MKKITLKFRARDGRDFQEIVDGLKWVETRAATERYREIMKGDILRFTCGKKVLEKKVKTAHIFKSISAMLKKYKITDIMPSISSLKEMRAAYDSYPGYKEKIKKHGLIAFEI